MMIQPFTFQFCTAFRERKQLADKTNEIIEVINSADLENLPTEIENIEQDITNLNTKVEDYNTTQNQNIANLSDYVDAERVIIVNRLNAIEEDIDKIKSPNWYLPRNTDPIFDLQNKKVLCDAKIEFHITYRYSLPNVTGDKTVRLLKTIRFKKGDIINSNNSILDPISIFDTSTNDPMIGYTLLNITASSIDYGIQHTSSQINLTLATHMIDTVTEDATINTNIIPIWYQYGDAGQNMTETSYINVYADRNQI